MQRLPLLFISLFLLALAGTISYFWIAYATASIQEQEALVQNLAQSSFHNVPLVFAALAIFGFIIWLWALIHMLTNKAIQGADKIVWTLVIIFLNVLGGIIYFVVSPFVKTADH